jgi:maltooligosyltrehalose synthase
MKLHVIERVLELRARRPEAFAGAYTAIDAGPDAIAFTRGDDGELLVVVTPRAPELGVTIDLPEARYRDVLTHNEQDLAGPTPAASLAAPHGLVLLERL